MNEPVFRYFFQKIGDCGNTGNHLAFCGERFVEVVDYEAQNSSNKFFSNALLETTTTFSQFSVTHHCSIL